MTEDQHRNAMMEDAAKMRVPYAGFETTNQRSGGISTPGPKTDAMRARYALELHLAETWRTSAQIGALCGKHGKSIAGTMDVLRRFGLVECRVRARLTEWRTVRGKV